MNVVCYDLIILLIWLLNIVIGGHGYDAETEYTRDLSKSALACTWTDLDRCTDIASSVILNPANWHLPDTVLWCKFIQTRRDCLLTLMCDKSAINETPFNFTSLLKNQVRTYLIYESLGFCNEHGYTYESDESGPCHLTSIRRQCLEKASLYIKSPGAVACQGVLKVLYCIEHSQQQCGVENPPSPTNTNIHRMYDEGHCQFIPFRQFEYVADEWRRKNPYGFCSNCI
ncbi:uncharacterized protein LOC144441160 [Glandiceps talaboti]